MSNSPRCNVLLRRGGVSPVDVRYLKTLVAVAEYGTFAAAANAVGLSPSAVSMQIQAIAAADGAQNHRPAR